MNRKKAVFVTATGTDIGKTYVSALLVKKMREYGLNCGYYKPALSGAIKQKDGTLLPGDCDFVAKFAGIDIDPNELFSYCFEEAVSPHLASYRCGINIELTKIIEDYEKSFDKFDYLLVEGAGGITCPFNLKEENKILLPDVITALDLGIVIVADGGLGTINSVLLTVDYAKTHNIKVKGVILNNYDESNFMHIDNKIQIENLTGTKVIATVAKNETELKIDKNTLEKLFI
ncbi:dethiobiotin synthase [bacterium]|nr:dethiobiotin synthase [bacterium]